MPRTKEQYEQIRTEKRQLIKESALKLFAEKGYDATSISEIAKKAEISKGLLYNYFASKDDLLKTIWDDLIEEFEVMIDPNNDGDVTDAEAENFIDATFEMLKNKREEMKLYYQLSFQPNVVNFLYNKYDISETQKRQKFIFGYFIQKIPFLQNEFGFFSIASFFKGLFMVATYTEGIFNNDFLDKYKAFLKSLVFKV
ncbi:MAG: TetR/AcrR family transcriptional regulator [Prevotellaceae bacterium]|jgi:AcrR family transcriptional regulator|nr:TetR/AcrR family transcriptional regulator [Prevotellaceae bacterium]